MYRKLFFTGVSCLLFACSVGQEEVKKSSDELCKCFAEYNEDNKVKIEQTINCLATLKEDGAIETIPQKKLLKQVAKDCPAAKKHIDKLVK